MADISNVGASGLEHWYNAVSSSFVLSGDSVVRWDDLVGDSNLYSTAYRPKLSTGTTASFVYFDGVNDALTAILQDGIGQGNDPYTIQMSLSIQDLTDHGTFLSLESSSSLDSSRDSFQIHRQAGLPPTYRWNCYKVSANGTETYDMWSTATFTTNTAYTIQKVFDGTHVKVNVNGTWVISGSSYNLSGAFTPDRFYLGAKDFFQTDASKIRVSEVVYWSEPLSDIYLYYARALAYKSGL